MDWWLVWYAAAGLVATAAVVLSLLSTVFKPRNPLPKGFVPVDYRQRAKQEFERLQKEAGGDYAKQEALLKKQQQRDCTRQAFKERRLPSSIDAIVVGSGIGGLMCAGLLARCGKKVVVLEQHYVAGGCTHCFADKGYEFDTGVHYVGKIRRYQYLLDLVTDVPVAWEQMGSEADGYTYDEIHLADLPPHRLRAGVDNFRKDLVARFPEEEAAVDEYIRLVRAANDSGTAHFMLKLLPVWLARLLRPLLAHNFAKYAGMSVEEVLRGVTDNLELRALLCGQFGDYGLAPPSASFFIHAGVVAHYFSGAWYPHGGPQEIARHIIPVIEAAGGAVFVKAPVREVEYDAARGCTVGVLLANKENSRISAPIVISAAGAANTYGRLLGDAALHRIGLPASSATPIANVGASVAHIYCFIGLNASVEELQLRSSNIWQLPCDSATFDLHGMREAYFAQPHQAPMLMFIGFPAAKDPTWSERFPSKSTCVVIAEAKYEWFASYAEDTPGKRSDDYQLLKNRFSERILEEGVYRHYPQTRGHVDYVQVGTPLTNSHYLAAPTGESYGLEHTPARYLTAHEHLGPRTPISGLYLTGQDVATAGFAGGLMGGVLTTHAVLGYPSLLDVVQGRELISEVANIRAHKPQFWYTACGATL